MAYHPFKATDRDSRDSRDGDLKMCCLNIELKRVDDLVRKTQSL